MISRRPEDVLRIETSRLVLRPPRLADLVPFAEMWSDPDVAAFMDDFGPRDLAGVRTWLAGAVLASEQAPEKASESPPSSVQFTVTRQGSETAIGWIGLGVSNRGVADWDFGYAIHPDHRGHGYIAEALAAALETSHERYDVDSFWGECHAGNDASAKSMVAAGLAEITPSGDGQRRFVLRYPR